MSQYKVGTAAVTNGSNVVTGSGTAWLANVSVGDGFILAGVPVPYTVSSVDSNTQIKLSASWSGASDSGAYAIFRDFTSQYNLPELSQGDIETATIWTRAMRLIDQLQAASVVEHENAADPHPQYLLDTRYEQDRLRESLLAEATLNFDFANNKYEVYEGPVDSLTQRPFNGILDYARSGVASARNATGGLTEVAAGDQRLVGNREGLLIEEQRTNKALYSEALNLSPWSSIRLEPVSFNQTIAPDGVNSADEVIQAAGETSAGALGQTVTISTGATTCVSAFVKKNTSRYAMIVIVFGGNGGRAVLDLDTGTIVEQTNFGGFVLSGTLLEEWGNGWYRLGIYGSAAGSSSCRIQLYPALDGPAFNTSATPGDSSYFWGAQIEQGLFPTSYIKTQGSITSRIADACTRTLGAEWSQSEGTLFVEGSLIAEQEDTFSFLDNGSIRRYFYAPGSTNSLFSFDGDNVVSLPLPAGESYTSGVKMAISLTPDSRILAVAGSTNSGPHNGNLLVNAILDFAGYTVSNKIYRRVVFIPRALSASELEVLTA